MGLLSKNPVIELKTELPGSRFIEKSVTIGVKSEIVNLNSQRESYFKMAKFNDPKIAQLKKEMEQSNLTTNGVKSDLQSLLREAMKTENVNVGEYVFQLE